MTAHGSQSRMPRHRTVPIVNSLPPVGVTIALEPSPGERSDAIAPLTGLAGSRGDPDLFERANAARRFRPQGAGERDVGGGDNETVADRFMPNRSITGWIPDDAGRNAVHHYESLSAAWRPDTGVRAIKRRPRPAAVMRELR